MRNIISPMSSEHDRRINRARHVLTYVIMHYAYTDYSYEAVVDIRLDRGLPFCM